MQGKKEILKKYFGYDEFRDGQEFLIDNILDGKNVVGVMPTGAGKSLCFQVPAMVFEGITIVISPLISLMKDQVLSLVQVGIKAAFINSSLTQSQCKKAISNAINGMYKIIYVAPERLFSDDFLYFATKANISMVTIDEAHCISQWGQDFRPHYTQIPNFVKKLKTKPIVSAFTATATQKVREDIILNLELKNPKILVTGFDRKNLFFGVEKPKNKKKAILSFLEDKKDKSGIIYCSTRKHVDDISKFLCENGFKANTYHAGLDDKTRSKNQEDFIFDRVNIVVATNAFGMGIDKSNVSYVIHYNMPKNIESYYQEAGRAGRDGSDSICILYFSGQDVIINKFLIESGQSDQALDYDQERLLKARDMERLKFITQYCNTNECLRAFILKYFGENIDKNCENCSSCNGDFILKNISVESKKILTCIENSNERFGITRISEILVGSKNKKIVSLGLDKLSEYDSISESRDEVCQIINFLVQNEYLFSTPDEYSVLKLGKYANEILDNNINLEMKISEQIDETFVEKEKSIRKKSKQKNKELYTVNPKLFEALKQKRLEIANNQKTPAFMVFADTTLIDMCMKNPKTKEDFLEISGVGDVKCEKYSEEFLKTIKLFNEKNDIIDKNSIFEIEIPAIPVTIGKISDILNCTLMQKGAQKTTGKIIKDWLIKNNFLEYCMDCDQKEYISPTKKGTELGFTLESQEDMYGNKFESIFSSKKSTKYIVDNFSCDY